MPSTELARLAGKRVVIWGAGREGRAALKALDGIAVASLVVIDDSASDDSAVLTGDAAERALNDAEVVIKSPGVSRYDPRAQAVIDRGALLTGGSALWMAEHHARTVAVTGSKGKSTTSALIHHLLSAAGIENTYGGNIGVPLLDLALAPQYVVELSSYQCAELTASPDVAVLTALFPEHLNWHGSAERYYADKLNLIAHDPGAVVFNAADPTLAPLARDRVSEARLVPVIDDSILEGSEVQLLGTHNRRNAALAVTAAQIVAQRNGVELRHSALAEALRTFTPLPHRLAVVADEPATGLRFVDDSLSTAPQAAIAALDAFPTGPLCLIVGGQDRGVDYSPLRDQLAATGREITVIGIPASGGRITAAVDDVPTVTTRLAEDLSDAVRLARAALPDGGTVLLSPAAPSYGIFRDYAERGDAFAKAVAATAPGT